VVFINVSHTLFHQTVSGEKDYGNRIICKRTSSHTKTGRSEPRQRKQKRRVYEDGGYGECMMDVWGTGGKRERNVEDA